MVMVGDRVRYRDNEGVIKTIMDDMYIVTLSDGKDYSLPMDSVVILPKPSSPAVLADVIRPHIKDMGFLNMMAKMMGDAGVAELIIRNGAIQAFNAKESLEERIARYKAEALAAAEQKARDDHEKEGK